MCYEQEKGYSCVLRGKKVFAEKRKDDYRPQTVFERACCGYECKRVVFDSFECHCECDCKQYGVKRAVDDENPKPCGRVC